ncbi:hypothetical protein M011DRAFT_477037 [Sporormia fimetaria CBS 119925]|uniref:Uncharacterized protein n=1 Tax=Sporormia fimetaria CBS 119925 TaxID=1340428 RepID=A0A6A6VFB2_9PLEO|nr:hypothetical protein M011DRAFT_477037 [Sporormia fimetaria CBS 119925]
MEEHIYTQTLVDGQWVQRALTLDEALANAERTDEMLAAGPKQCKHCWVPPRVGLLTQTLIPSSSVNFVLPARLRHTGSSDVVFVGEYFVHLKETLGDGSLRHITSKTDFQGRIVDARVFGPPASQQNTPTNREHLNHYESATSRVETDDLPPELLVLTLDTGSLVILWTHQTSTGNVNFRQQIIPLRLGFRYGRLLAIDPKQRAIAVAARSGPLVLYETRDVDTWRDQSRTDKDVTLIRSERHVPLEGRIMHMEFLNSSVDECGSHIVLVLVVAHAGRTQIVTLDWDARTGLNSYDPKRALRMNLDPEDAEPLLLIPLNDSPDFLLVCNHHISTYTNILSGVSRPAHRTELPRESSRPGHVAGSRIGPSWVQWSRATRNPGFQKEVIYVAREDGLVLYLEIRPSKLLEISIAGQLPQAVDRAFTCLPLRSHDHPDMLLTAGVIGDGCVTSIGSWGAEDLGSQYSTQNTIRPLGLIPNWSPISDMTFGPKRTNARDSIFVACGRAPHGSIAELWWGLEASLASFVLEGLNGATGIWVIDHGSIASTKEADTMQSYVVLLVCLFEETHVIRLACSQCDWDMLELGPECSLLEDTVSPDETIAATVLNTQASVQVSRTGVRLLRRPNLEVIDQLQFQHYLLASATTTDLNIIAVAYQKDKDVVLEVVGINNELKFGSRLQATLSSEPTCLEVIECDGTLLVMVCTADAEIRLYAISASSLRLSAQLKLPSAPEDGSIPVCETTVPLRSRTGNRLDHAHFLACGTRDGKLAIIELQKQSADFILTMRQFDSIGSMPVYVARCDGDPSVAFVSCAEESAILKWRGHQDGRPPYEIASLGFTGPAGDAHREDISKMVHLSTTAPGTATDIRSQSTVFAISKHKLWIAQVDAALLTDRPWRGRSLRRRWAIGATPSRILYVEHLGKFVVATTEPKAVSGPPEGYRTIQSSLQLIHATDVDMKDDLDVALDAKGRSALSRYPLDDYERVYTMIEWVVRDTQSKRHHFIYVGTGITGKWSESGRKLLFQVARNKFELKKQYKYDSPVRAMAFVSDKRLLTAVGKDLLLEEYQIATKRWATLAKIELPSPGIFLSFNDRHVHVSTARDSLKVFELEQSTKKGNPPKFLAPLFSDTHLRNSTRHIDYDIEAGPTVMLSDKTCTVTGLAAPRNPTNGSDASTLFEARLPRTVTRFAHGSSLAPLLSPWTPKNIPDLKIGACTDGTIYRLTTVKQQQFGLLKLIQNVIDAKISHLRFAASLFLGPSRAKALRKDVITVPDARVGCSHFEPENMHVDLDVIERYLMNDIPELRWQTDPIRELFVGDDMVDEAVWQELVKEAEAVYADEGSVLRVDSQQVSHQVERLLWRYITT